jgi:hypothetical protein
MQRQRSRRRLKIIWGSAWRTKALRHNKSLNPTPRQQFFHGQVVDCGLCADRSARVISIVMPLSLAKIDSLV